MIGIAEIQRVVAQAYGLERRDMLNRSRRRLYAEPRMVAMTLSRELTKASLHQISARFGRDHTTVLNATAKVRLKAERSATLRQRLDEIRMALLGKESWRERFIQEFQAARSVAEFVHHLGGSNADT